MRLGTSRRKTPVVLQMEATECGAACLSMVCAYWGKYVSLDQMRIQLGVSRDGASAGSIMRAAKRMGLDCHAYRNMGVDRLRGLDSPAILFWRGAHFVVLDGFEGDFALVNDPALGRRRVDAAEFGESYSGMAMTFVPTEAFELAPKEGKLIPLAKRRLDGMWGIVALAVLLSVFMACVPVFMAALLKVLFDSAWGGDASDATWAAAAFAAAVVVGFSLDRVRVRFLERLRNRLVLLSSHDFIRRLFQLPLAFFSQRFTGDLLARIAGNDRANDFLAKEVPRLFLDAALLVVCLVALIAYSPLLAAVCAVALGLFFLGSSALARRASDEALGLQQEQGRLLGLVYAGLGVRRSLKATGAEGSYEQQILEFDAQVGERQRAHWRASAIADALGVIAPFALCVLVAYLGAGQVLAGQLSTGSAAASLLLSWVALGAVGGLLDFTRSLGDALGDIERADDVMRFPVEERKRAQGDGRGAPMKLSGRVQLDHVTFSYSDHDAPAVRDISFHVDPGALIALVGPSGCGKSTVARIVCGLLEPDEGTVLFDGAPLEQVPTEVLHASVSTVGQRICVFSGSVRDNVTLWSPAVLEADVVAALRDACLYDDICAKPGGLDYQLVEGGVNLSGGQRQRLEIARALATSPSVLVLDEATSALDEATEREVIDNILRRGCSCIVISHRPGAMRASDQVLFMEEGSIVERGSHERLLAQSGRYAQVTNAGGVGRE